MPFYIYVCSKCHVTFDKLRPMDERDDLSSLDCPECNASGPQNFRRVLHGASPSLVFKGSGFYITDYKNKSSQHKEKSSSVPDPPK